MYETETSEKDLGRKLRIQKYIEIAVAVEVAV